MSRIVDADKKRALCARLARIEGQLRGLQKLIDGDADCEKIAQQMAAARLEGLEAAHPPAAHPERRADRAPDGVGVPAAAAVAPPPAVDPPPAQPWSFLG